MKKIIWIIVALLIGSYLVYSYLDKRAKSEADRIESERIAHNIKLSVENMVSNTNAFVDWDKQLSKGENFRFDPILTIELEKLWLINRPILFLGAIKDIASNDDHHYIVSVERGFLADFKYMFDTELQLNLIVEKKLIDDFLNKYPEIFKEFGFNNGVAVVANIKSIRSISIPGDDGERDEVKIGDGDLLDIVYTGTISF